MIPNILQQAISALKSCNIRFTLLHCAKLVFDHVTDTEKGEATLIVSQVEDDGYR